MRLTTDWARTRGRSVLALTVDHRLNPDSGRWTDFATRAARIAGADWRGLSWDGDKPATGLTAAARAARHGLIADAAREAGASVVLFAHTADDIAEADLMRSEGSTLGRVREWSPSPAWPKGRGLMLLRPLLGERRAGLRDWLAAQGADWIEDPANADPRFGRSRARQALAGAAPQPDDQPPAKGGARPTVEGAAPQPDDQPPAKGGARPTVEGESMACVDRDVGARALAAALVCVGGGSTPPRGARLDALMARLKAGEDFAATLCGTRIEAVGLAVRLMREAGELRRRDISPLALTPGVEAVWDGRFVFCADHPGWSVVPARGRLASLSDADRAELNRLPAATRGAWPVLIRDDAVTPVLAGEGVERCGLVAERLRLALDETTHEDDLISATR
ncbi:tRNA lysidine(34) synthetase [Brevundimonas vesicularis]|uniref:tRNA lysidine(34) synthetase n=1 Tax=Brevundimonas vesicularis TaxID=41276 RepID=UPI003AF478FF